MRASKLLSLIPLCTLLLALAPFAGKAQSVANYIGPTTGGEWNTPANWDIGVPADTTTNAVIGSGTNVNYNLPMVATSFGMLTNKGVVNINTNGFNNTGIIMINSNGQLFINSNGVVNDTGNLAFCSNSIVTMAAGSTLNISGSLLVGSGSTGGTGSGTVGSYGTMTNNGGTLTATTTSINPGNGSLSTASALLVINGGTNNLGSVSIKRSNGPKTAFSTLGTEGLVIYNGQVTMTSLNVGATANSWLTAWIAGGVVTNNGPVTINQGTSARGSRLLQTGGFFAVPDPQVINPNPTISGTLNILAVTGGTNVSGGLYFGTATSPGTVSFTNSAVMYIGSQGISSNGAVTLSAVLMNGGMFGATAPWEGSSTMTLNSGIFTLQSADMTGLPNNITLINPLIGNGGLNVIGSGAVILDATNTYTGNTVVNAGTLSLGQSGLLASPAIYVGSSGTYDVSELTTPYIVNSGQTLGGFGTVTGAVSVASGGIMDPGSNSVTGTLSLQGNLTESGGVVNQFTLTTPGGANDVLNITGNLTLSGSNNIILTGNGGGALPFGTYPLFKYTGTLTGGTANFGVTLVSDNATLTNITTTTPPEIAVVLSAGTRAPTNLLWRGDGSLNAWDNTSSNWFNTSTTYSFQTGDSVFFTDAGNSNTNINLTISALPAVVIFSNSIQYNLSGNGNIGGPMNLIKTNIGTAIIQTTNTYTGITYLDQGVLSTPLIANSFSPSGIGAAGTDPGNIVFSGGTLAYTGPSTSTDHGMTLTNGGGTIDVTNNASLTLNGLLNGPGSLTVGGGTLILSNPNTYTNGTLVSNALLELGSDNANNAGTSSGVGPTNAPVTLENDGTLQLFGYGQSDTPSYNTFYNPIIVPSGQTGNLRMFPRGPTDTGSGAGLFSSLSGDGTLNLKVNYVRDALSGNWSAFTGVINVTNTSPVITNDEFRINNNFGYSNATIDLVGPVIMDSTLNANATINIGALDGIATAFIGPGSKSQPGPTWCVGWNNQNAAFSGSIADDNTAPGGHTSVIKVGTGTWALGGAYTTNIITLSDGFTMVTNIGINDQLTYLGNTTISNGTFALIGGDNLTNSPVVTLAASTAVVDASQMEIAEVVGGTTNFVTDSTFELVAGQTLNGIGTLNGILQQDAGSTFNVGLPTGTFTVTTDASLSGTINMSLNGSASSEIISPAFTNTSLATLNVTNAGPGLINGVTFHLFNQGVSAGFAAVNLPATDPTGTTNYTWANNLTSDGTITLTTGGLPTVGPKITFGVSAGSLSLNWGSTGYTLQMQTNAPGVGISTNWVNVPGSTALTGTNITINPATPSEFFRLTQ
ncbi:MAG TPA: autotransporter-associated beta strand repeat-containing protein [Verrucomicrobiae bacterium]